jgi:hypothetical protein
VIGNQLTHSQFHQKFYINKEKKSCRKAAFFLSIFASEIAFFGFAEGNFSFYGLSLEKNILKNKKSKLLVNGEIIF